MIKEDYTFADALARMQAGHKMTRKESERNWIYQIKDGQFVAYLEGDKPGSFQPGAGSVNMYMQDIWVDYEEPGHDFQWALEQMLAGNKVRRKVHSEYVTFFIDSSIRQGYTNSKIVNSPTLYRPDFQATDWIPANV